MNKLVEWCKKHTIVIMFFGVIGLLLGAGLIRWAYNHKATTPDRHIVYDGDDSKPIQERLFNVSKDAKSAVCTSLTAAEVEKVIGKQTNGAQVSIPTTKQASQTVSACTYAVADTAKESTNLRSVLVTQRVYADAKAAVFNFGTLTKKPSAGSRQLSKTMLYNGRASQLVAQKNSALITVVILRADTSKEVAPSVFTDLLNAL